MSYLVDNWSKLLETAEEAALGNEGLTPEQALSLTQLPDELVQELSLVANRVRRHFMDDAVDLCSIISARSGRCSEDCAFCAQSSHHQASCPVYSMKTVEEIFLAAQRAEDKGAIRFSIVTSGGRLSEEDFSTALKAIALINNKSNLKTCASLGELSEKRVERLSSVGLTRYHHNIETAPSFFPEICSTHSYEDKLRTIDIVKSAGLELCSGCILNMGESPSQRIELAFALRDLDVTSVPINFLSPIPGTPLADRPPISTTEAAKYLAIFRLILPQIYIRLAGGRVETFGDHPALPFTAGINGLIIGDLLTTPGADIDSDLAMLESLGFNRTVG